MHLVPPVVLFMAKHGLVDNFDTSSLNTILCGAAPLGEPVTKELCERLNVELRQGKYNSAIPYLTLVMLNI